MPLKVFENSGLGHKPKKRVKPEYDEDASMLDEDPVDPATPSAEELAEFSAPEPVAAPAPAVAEEIASPVVDVEAEKPRRARKQKSAEA